MICWTPLQLWLMWCAVVAGACCCSCYTHPKKMSHPQKNISEVDCAAAYA